MRKTTVEFPVFPILGQEDAEGILREMAGLFAPGPSNGGESPFGGVTELFASSAATEEQSAGDAKYRALVEQLPAVVFMAYLDRGAGEAYVSPLIEEVLGFSQEEWLEDPVRWYRHIHAEDQLRWSVEAAEMLLTGKPLRSAYRVLARDGRVVWFHCDAKMVRRDDGTPWFIHGVAFDITELKQTEQALHDEHNLVSAILDTVSALVAVLQPDGRILRFNRECERVTGYSFEDVRGRPFHELFVSADDAPRIASLLREVRPGRNARTYESDCITRHGEVRRIAWSTTALRQAGAKETFIITSGTDITERKRMEREILEISTRDQRKIGQDLHDGLGQHLTGIAFLSKVLQQRLDERGEVEAVDAAKIVRLVNEAINKTRELARGLLPVFSETDGLMTSLRRWSVEVEDLFHIPCQFYCGEPVHITDIGVATHLFRVAQEAVSNAIKHAHAKRVVIALARSNGFGTLTIEDDGIGLPDAVPNHEGLGLRIMTYRASMIGGTLDVRRGASGGTVVRCQFLMRDLE